MSAEAEALRSAACDLDTAKVGMTPVQMVDWLYDRADEIEVVG